MRSLLRLAALSATLTANNNSASALTTSRIRTRSQPIASDYFLPSLSPPTLESTVEETLERGLTKDRGLSPYLQGMVDEQRELQMNVGKAMDVLRNDYPYFLKRAPEYSIYHDSISLSASDGQIQLSKLSSYKKALRVMRTMISLVYDTDRSVVQNRVVYDPTKTQIRVSFNAMLVPRPGPLAGKTVHLDGISVYSLDLSPTRDEEGNVREGAGKIVEHRIEKLLVNGAVLQPPYFGVFGLETMTGQQAGALVGAGAWS